MAVIILGGGIIGLTMANLLAQDKKLKIILIEAKKLEFNLDNTQYDARCSAINYATQQVFTQLGIWPSILQQRVGIYRHMQVWADDFSAAVNFAASEVGQPVLGHIIENRVMQAALYNKLLEQTNVEIIYGLANKLEQYPEFNRLHINDYYLDAELIIGADGANSWLRRAVNIHAYALDYQHSALVATIKSQYAHAHTARQRFTAYGPLAFLPLDNEHVSSIVWSAPKDKISELMQLLATDFCTILSKEFDGKLGDLELYGVRASYPLRMLHAQSYIAPRVALMGDAVHVVHPLAGQGLNLGIMDAVVLQQIIQQAVSKQQDFGARSWLRKYERRCKSHNITVLSMVEVLKRTFEMHSSLWQAVRSNGMRVVNNFVPVKQAMMQFAMGLSDVK